MAQNLNRIPTIEELSKFLNIDIETIRQVQIATSNILSLDAEEERPIYDTIPSASPELDLELDIKDSFHTLTKEEQDIIKYRYYKDYTQSETANILGMSQVTVSRYEKKSLKKMYNYLND